MESNLQTLKKNHYKLYFNFTFILLIIIIISSNLISICTESGELSSAINMVYIVCLLCYFIFYRCYIKGKLTKVILYLYVFIIGLAGILWSMFVPYTNGTLNPFVIALLVSTVYFEYNPLHYLYIQMLNCTIWAVIQFLYFDNQINLYYNMIYTISTLVLCYLIVLDRYNLILISEKSLVLSKEKNRRLEVLNSEIIQKTNELCTMDSLVDILILALETRDYYSAGHSKRVGEISLAIGKQIGMDKTSLEELKIISILHDIGKIGISDSVLKKAGKLTTFEWNEIKKHPTHGYDLLKKTNLNYRNVIAVKHHHERYDGHGYPDGLSGENIPLYSRIIAIADSYDAMTSDRVYRKAISHEEAIIEITLERNKQFDPRLVQYFIDSTLDNSIEHLSEMYGINLKSIVS